MFNFKGTTVIMPKKKKKKKKGTRKQTAVSQLKICSFKL